MAMRLADDEITVSIGDDTMFLRPSLRAAFRLERRYGGFSNLITKLAECNVTAMADVIRESSGQSNGPDFLDHIAYMPLGPAIECLIEPLIDHVFALAGIDRHAPLPPAQSDAVSSRITFAEHHAQLFRIATGWLGWTPAEAWDATPAEIIEAHKGRIELLQAIFGGGKSDTPTEPDFERDEAGIAGLKFLAASGGNRG